MTMIQRVIQNWYREIVEDKYTLALTIVLLCGGAYWGSTELYKRYSMHVGGKAQIVVAESVEEYDKALYNYFEKDGAQELALQQFEDVQIAFDTVLKQHGSSSLVPYALSLKADTFALKGEFKDALTVLDSAISKMSSSTPGYYLLKTKHALVQLDAGQVDVGLTALRDLAFNDSNPTFDTAAFFLGYYYWTQHNKDKAREVWKQLETAENKKMPSATSVWLQLAQEKLQNIS
jgi:tetratricopeptide (TPR) repeat protein